MTRWSRDQSEHMPMSVDLETIVVVSGLAVMFIMAMWVCLWFDTGLVRSSGILIEEKTSHESEESQAELGPGTT